MVTITPDPADPQRLILTQTVTVYLDRVLVETLSDELTNAITEQAKKDLLSNSTVRKLVAKAATEKLLSMLGYVPGEEKKPSV
jgi:hypothetical protein